MDKRWMVLAAMALAACDPEDTRHGTQIGDEGTEADWGCSEVSREPIADPTVPAEGFDQSPEERWAVASGAFTGELALDAGGTAPLTLDVAAAGGWELVRRDVATPSGGEEPAIEIACFDAYVRPVTVTVVADGHLDEVIDVELALEHVGTAAFAARIDLADVGGDAAPTRFDPVSMDEVWMSLSARQEPGAEGWQGDVAFQGERTSGSGPDGAVSLTNDPYGMFDAVRE